MTDSTTVRQRRFRDRMREAGFVQVNVWVPSDQKEFMLKFVRDEILAKGKFISKTSGACLLHRDQIDLVKECEK